MQQKDRSIQSLVRLNAILSPELYTIKIKEVYSNAFRSIIKKWGLVLNPSNHPNPTPYQYPENEIWIQPLVSLNVIVSQEWDIIKIKEVYWNSISSPQIVVIQHIMTQQFICSCVCIYVCNWHMCVQYKLLLI